MSLRQGLFLLACALPLTTATAQQKPGKQAQPTTHKKQGAIDSPRLEEALNRAAEAQSASRYAEAAAAYADALALNPYTAELWANRGLMEHFAGSYAASKESLEHALSLKPVLFTPYLFVGLDELELGKPGLAVRHLEHARTLQPNDAQTEAALGRAYLMLHQPRLGAGAYTAATSLDASNKATWYGLGAASIAIIEKDGEVLATHFSDSPWARALYADDLLQQGRTAEALDIYRTIAKVSSPAERTTLLATVRQSRDSAESKEGAVTLAVLDSVIEALSSSPDQALPRPACPDTDVPAKFGSPVNFATNKSVINQHRQIACLYWQGRSLAASEAAGDCLALSPNDPEALFWSVKANERRAIEALTHFEQLAPQSAATFNLLGDLYRRRAQPDNALQEYAKAQAITPRDPGALLGRAAALLAAGRMEEASAAAQDALTDAPADPHLNLILSDALIERHHFVEAQPHLRSALSSIDASGTPAPENIALAAHAHALLGRTEAETGDLQGAIAEMTLGLKSDADGSLSYQLSRLYRRNGNFAEARKAEERARALQAQRREHASTAVIDSPGQVP